MSDVRRVFVCATNILLICDILPICRLKCGPQCTPIWRARVSVGYGSQKTVTVSCKIVFVSTQMSFSYAVRRIILIYQLKCSETCTHIFTIARFLCHAGCRVARCLFLLGSKASRLPETNITCARRVFNERCYQWLVLASLLQYSCVGTWLLSTGIRGIERD